MDFKEEEPSAIWMLFTSRNFIFFPRKKKAILYGWTAGSRQVSFTNQQIVYGFANIITMGTAVYEPYTREFLGVLLFNIDLNTFSDAVEYAGDSQKGNTFLIGKDGVLCGFSPSIHAPSFPKIPELFSKLKERGHGIHRTRINRQNVLLAYEQIPDTEMLACYVADLDSLLRHTYHIRDLCVLVLYRNRDCMFYSFLLCNFQYFRSSEEIEPGYEKNRQRKMDGPV